MVSLFLSHGELASSQDLDSTLRGVVRDATGAVIPNVAARFVTQPNISLYPAPTNL